MDALLWLMILTAYAVCIYLWRSEFGKRFPRRPRARVRRRASDSAAQNFYRPFTPKLVRSGSHAQR